MTWRKLYYFNRRVDMLWRKNRGDSLRAIAEHWSTSRQSVVQALKYSHNNPKVIEAANARELMEQIRTDKGEEYVPVEMRVWQRDPNDPNDTKMP